MARVLTTLDFDGVVSPIDGDRDFSEESNFSIFRLGGFRCAIADEVSSFVRELKELMDRRPEHFRLSWATSWVSLTEHFEAETGGVLPSLGYLEVSDSKARAIADAAIAEDASLVLVFEDSESVQHELDELWRRDMRLSGRQLCFFLNETAEGIQFGDILEARGLIAAELQRGL